MSRPTGSRCGCRQGRAIFWREMLQLSSCRRAIRWRSCRRAEAAKGPQGCAWESSSWRRGPSPAPPAARGPCRDAAPPVRSRGVTLPPACSTPHASLPHAPHTPPTRVQAIQKYLEGNMSELSSRVCPKKLDPSHPRAPQPQLRARAVHTHGALARGRITACGSWFRTKAVLHACPPPTEASLLAPRSVQQRRHIFRPVRPCED